MTFRSFALVGSGTIGAPIVRALASRNVSLVVLSRSISTFSVLQLESLPANVQMEKVDFTDSLAVSRVLKEHRVEVVVSTVTTEAVNSQRPLADAAKAAGARLFVPSEFGFPTDDPNAKGMWGYKRDLIGHLEQIGLPYVRIFVGLFIEFLPWVVNYPDTVQLVGAGDGSVSVTSIEDTSGFLAYILTTLPPSELENRTFRLQGDLISLKAFAATLDTKIEYVDEIKGVDGDHKTLLHKTMSAVVKQEPAVTLLASGPLAHLHRPLINMATPETTPKTEDAVAAKPDQPTAATDSEAHPVDTPSTTTPTAEPTTASIGATTMTESNATPSPEPTASQPEAVTEPPRQRELVVDERLGGLRAMFPDFDDSLLQSVLDSVNGNTDRAIDALLGMSDPDYQSEQPQAPPPMPTQSHEELDAQLARSLAMEDERERSAWPPQHQQQGRPEPPRRPSDGQERDTMQEITQQFNKIAESGRRTFGTFFNKVKAKIQELDQPGDSNVGYGNPNENPYMHQVPAPGAGAGRHAQQAYYQQQRQAQEQATMPAYYDPNATSTDHAPNAGYDTEPVSMPAPSGATPTPPSTNPGAPPIDAGKLGMLPKRPVSLLRTNPPPPGTSSGAPPSSDDDELEYAENPFEDKGRK
ncbi:CUE domain-containing protein [Mycena indigotica]|uniref:CUE domain-containing protein n=1 Tax=Mycena indigotica TaxID=2126181 RepID=A0A8H6WKL8_9AGAR|nr:CUE domain-containing protein [Mycena indigotica]KAF7315864.1 CUE domain-containing protein [Mycena indigotica]